MPETWYVLQDGSSADPNEVAPDKAGVLRHKSGVAVAMRGDVPSSRSVDPDEERKKAVRDGKKSPAEARHESGKSPIDVEPAKKPAAAKAREAEAPSNREMKAEGGQSYKTRGNPSWKRRT